MSGTSNIRTNGFARVASVAAAWVLVVAIGRAVRPQDSSASVVRPSPDVALATRSYAADHRDSTERGAVVGTLSGRNYAVTMRATPDGTRYDVADANGVAVARMLDAKALAASFPEIDVSSLTATPEGTAVMSAEGHRGADER